MYWYTPQPRRQLILVVDDEPHFATMMRYNLESEGHDVIIAYDAITGRQKALESVPNLIIADIFMPGIDGISMVEALLEHPELKEVPVIFVSGRVMENYVSTDPSFARRYALIKKPIILGDLNFLIHQFLFDKPLAG